MATHHRPVGNAQARAAAGRARIAAWLIAACALASGDAALALDPSLDVSQYGHRTWRSREGFANGRPVNVVAQTPDGYLWLGSPLGLMRFDGVRAVEWHPPPQTPLPDPFIRFLSGARDGTLWIGTFNGLASWDGRKLAVHPKFNGTSIQAIVEDDEGTVWVVASPRDHQLPFAWLCAIRAAAATCHGEDGSLGRLGALFKDSRGALWIGVAGGVVRWRPGSPVWYRGPNLGSVSALAELPSGALLVGTEQGLQQLVDGRFEPFALAVLREAESVRSLRVDRDGGLWVATTAGLVHVHQGRVDTFSRQDGLLDESVNGLLEDREGNIWAATAEGLERFRTLAAARYAAAQGVPGRVAAVLAGRDGSVWVATTAGLRRWRDGRWTAYRAARDFARSEAGASSASATGQDEVIVPGFPEVHGASLCEDGAGRVWVAAVTAVGYLDRDRFTLAAGVPPGPIDACAVEGDGSVWLVHRTAGLLQLSRDGSLHRLAWEALTGHGPASRLTVDRVRGGVWIGFFEGGVARVVDGRVRESFSESQGLGKGRVKQLHVDAGGALWAAMDGGLSRIKDGRIATLAQRGLPCDSVISTVEDADGATWLYTRCGLVRIARDELDAWASASDHGRPPKRVAMTVLDQTDGIPNVGLLETPGPRAARARDGRLWFNAGNSVIAVDPQHLPFNPLPPPVHIVQVVADGHTYDASPGPVHLPALVRDVFIGYTGPSFVAPQKVAFRYKLEGQDADWREVLNDRQVQYSNLAPGRYRFRVTASNESGVWNEKGATLELEVARAFWQTGWFRALCALAFAALLWVAYRLRVRQLHERFALGLEARVAERTRIARDLHDTLLQSFHGLLLRFQAALELLPARPVEARAMLASTIDQAADAITEGRDAVQALRESVTESNNLAAAIRALGDELRAQEGAAAVVAMRVEVHGVTRPLHPIVRDEAFRIAGEALRNALRHARATQIEVELVYDRQHLRLRVRDDGKGIDPQLLEQLGRQGHFGLAGMRERAAVIGGKLTVWSALEAGTEIELTVPAANAYVAAARDTASSEAPQESTPAS